MESSWVKIVGKLNPWMTTQLNTDNLKLSCCSAFCQFSFLVFCFIYSKYSLEANKCRKPSSGTQFKLLLWISGFGIVPPNNVVNILLYARTNKWVNEWVFLFIHNKRWINVCMQQWRTMNEYMKKNRWIYLYVKKNRLSKQKRRQKMQINETDLTWRVKVKLLKALNEVVTTFWRNCPGFLSENNRNYQELHKHQLSKATSLSKPVISKTLDCRVKGP